MVPGAIGADVFSSLQTEAAEIGRRSALAELLEAYRLEAARWHFLPGNADEKQTAAPPRGI